MTTLRTAAQQALEFIRAMNEHGWLLADYESDMERTVAGLEAALAQEQAEPVQGPVAKVELMTTGGNAGLATRIVEIDDHLRERLRPGQLLYTAPPKRVPLTDEEIDRVTDQQWGQGTLYAAFRAYARAVERALEEKNRGR